MNLKVVSLTALVAAASTAPAIAHHSFAMFDAAQTITLQGTVKEFEWRNPHSWLRVMVNDEKTGRQVLWALGCCSLGRRLFGDQGDHLVAVGRAGDQDLLIASAQRYGQNSQ
jgi:hypothetical protein